MFKNAFGCPEVASELVRDIFEFSDYSYSHLLFWLAILTAVVQVITENIEAI